MSQTALQAYILLILNDSHLGVLLQQNDRPLITDVTKELLLATEKLELRYLHKITQRLNLLCAGNEEQLALITENTNAREQKARLEKWQPYIVLFITMVLCLFMYWYGKGV
jgi:hypothetical protein